jgi:hypothetical protein
VVDIKHGRRETVIVVRFGASRQRLERALNAAYGDGLLSETTLAHRLDLLFGSRLIDPSGLVGDLTIRSPRRYWAGIIDGAVAVGERLWRGGRRRRAGRLLALDWTGGQDELLIGRHPSCDVVLTGSAVSRRHARLRFRDGTWIVQDLDSTNGTTVNNVAVGRCQLRPGDRLVIGDERIRVD